MTAWSAFLAGRWLGLRSRSSFLVGFLYGGLDSQIEHHLFPSMPRANLRRARTVVRAFCAEHDIPYAEQSLHHAYRDVAVHLRTVGGGAGAVVG